MTQAQVDQSYQAYQKAVCECEQVDLAHTNALSAAYALEAELGRCERECDRLWKAYERHLKALEASKI